MAGAAPPAAAAIAAAVPPPPPPPLAPAHPPVPLPFALTPALADDAVINYTTSEGKKLWKEASDQLPIGEFDGLNPQTLLRDLDQRAKTQGWQNILTVTVGTTQYYLPRQHGALTMAHVRAHSDTYMIGVQDRRTQNSLAMAECLYKSIDKVLRMKVTNVPDNYEYVINGHRVSDGPLFLMAILSHCAFKTMSTATNVRIQLARLHEYMRSDAMKAGDIIAFNTYINSLRNQLASLNQTMDNNDLLLHVLDGYKASTDSAFSAFMAQKHERIMYFSDPDNTIESVMQLAEQFYTDRVSKGTWARPSGEQEKIVVLEAQIRSMSNQKKGGKNKKGKGKKGNKTNKGNDGDRTNYSYEPSQAWKWVAPASGEPKTKKVKDVQYFWCPNHQHKETKKWGMWSRHKLSDCRAHPPTQNPSSHESRPKKFQALNTIIEHVHHDDDDADYDYN